MFSFIIIAVFLTIVVVMRKRQAKQGSDAGKGLV